MARRRWSVVMEADRESFLAAFWDICPACRWRTHLADLRAWPRRLADWEFGVVTDSASA